MGLAPTVVAEIFQTIRSLHERGTTILLVEQNAREALRISHRAYVLDTGRIILTGTGEELLEQRGSQESLFGKRLSGKMGTIGEEVMPIFNPDVETMERKDLLELQIERLQIVVNQAYSNVDFYRRKFDEAGLSPDDIKNLDDLERFLSPPGKT